MGLKPFGSASTGQFEVVPLSQQTFRFSLQSAVEQLFSAQVDSEWFSL